MTSSSVCSCRVLLTVCVTEEWLRPVMRKDKQLLVHWGLSPDR